MDVANGCKGTRPTSKGGTMAKEAQWPPKISRSKGLLHTQIANAVASSITLGHFRSGDRLPPERELAKEFGVNRLTVRQALAEVFDATR